MGIPKDFFGVVAKCQIGKIGVIYRASIPIDKKELCTYYGISLDGSAWQSIDPIYVAANIREYIENTVLDSLSKEIID